MAAGGWHRTIATNITFTLTLAGSVEDYNATAQLTLRTQIARSLGGNVSVAAVTLTITPASVRVRVSIATAGGAQASAVDRRHGAERARRLAHFD